MEVTESQLALKLIGSLIASLAHTNPEAVGLLRDTLEDTLGNPIDLQDRDEAALALEVVDMLTADPAQA